MNRKNHGLIGLEKRLLLHALLLLAIPARADVSFFATNGFFELQARDTTVNAILEELERTLRIPVSRLPRDRDAPFVHTRSRSLEKILDSFSEGYALLYIYDELGRPYLDAIEISTSANTALIDRQYRRQVIAEQRLQQRLPPSEMPQNIVYAGIGAYIQLADDGNAIWLRPMSPATPAAKAGIQLGDKVIRIDGQPISAFPDQAAIASAIRGPANTPVSFIIERPDGSQINQVVMREVIQNAP